jgi:transcriptional regulator GlxA family with amidase domain
MEMLELDGRFAGVLRDLAAWAVGDPAPDLTASAALLAGTSGDEAISRAVDLLVGTGGTVPISSLCAGAGLSDRQFRRRFLAATAVTPKQYADVQRVRNALIMALTEPSWAAVAHESGYADQPHLARSIKERFGSAACRVGGYFGGMRHEMLVPGDGRKVQDAPATIG